MDNAQLFSVDLFTGLNFGSSSHLYLYLFGLQEHLQTNDADELPPPTDQPASSPIDCGKDGAVSPQCVAVRVAGQATEQLDTASTHSFVLKSAGQPHLSQLGGLMGLDRTTQGGQDCLSSPADKVV